MTETIAQLAIASGRLAIDTEFISESRYRTQLCLVQVAVPDAASETGVRTEVLDPLDRSDPFDPAPLAEALADPAVQVIVHAGRQDLMLLRGNWDTAVTNVFDTQVAAGFLDMGNQEGYESLVKRVLDVKLRGGQGFTRWDLRPLTEQQIGYAADDAAYLLTLGEELERRLSERGRLAWAHEECLIVENSDDDRSAERSFARLLSQLKRLDGSKRAVAKRLVEWREKEAERIDRPPKSVVADHILVQIANRCPTAASELGQIRGFPEHLVKRHGRDLVAIVAAGLEDEPPPIAPQGPRGLPTDAAIVALASALVRQRARENGVAVELIATKSDLAGLVATVLRDEDGSGIRVLHGWRRELVGDELCRLVAGELAVSVGPDGLLVRDA